MLESRSLLASGSYDQSIRLWDVNSGKHVGSVPHAEAQVNTMALVPKSLQLAVGTWQKVRLFDISTAQPVIASSYEPVNRNITAVGFEPQARWMFTGGDDAHCRIFDVRGSQLQCQRAFEVSCGITTVVLHYNLVELFLADQAGHVYIWDLSKQDSHERIPCPSLSAMEFVVKLAVHPKGHELSGITNRGNLLTWELAAFDPDQEPSSLSLPSTSAKFISIVNLNKSVGLGLRYTPDGLFLAATFADANMVVLKSDDHSIKHYINAGCGWNWDVVFSSDSRYMFTGGNDAKVKLWDVEAATLVTCLEGHLKAITSLCCSEGI